MNIKKISNFNNKPTKTDKLILEKFKSISEAEILQISISEIAKKFNVAKSTITKFLYKYGFSGWKQFKIVITLNLTSKNYNNSISKKEIMFFARQFSELILQNTNLNIFVFGQGDTHTFSQIISKNLRKLGLIAFSYEINDDVMNYYKGESIHIYQSISGMNKVVNNKLREISKKRIIPVVLTVYGKIISRSVKYNYKLSNKTLNLNMDGFLYGISELSLFWSYVFKQLSSKTIHTRTNLLIKKNK